MATTFGTETTEVELEEDGLDRVHNENSNVVDESLKTESQNQGESQKKYASLLSVFMILTTWSTSSSNVLYPFTFGVLGVVGGPILMLLAFAIAYTATIWTVRSARAVGAKTFGELGFALAGKNGRILFEGSQILFQQLFLPVAIVLCTGAAQSLAQGTEFASCNGNVV